MYGGCWLVHCPEPKTGQQKVHLYYKTIHFDHLVILLIFAQKGSDLHLDVEGDPDLTGQPQVNHILLQLLPLALINIQGHEIFWPQLFRYYHYLFR